MPRLLQLVHGYPPSENAGVEQYSLRNAVGLRSRGWDVHIVAATRRPGARMYEVIRAPDITRIVNNSPFSGVRRAETDGAMAAIIEAEIARFRPDIVHVQHAMFLDTRFRCARPLVWTLHDAWAWCAAGGALFRDGHACAGPSIECVKCASAWCRDAPAIEPALAIAGAVGRLVSPAQLHRAWKRFPAGVRALAARPGPAVSPAQLAARSAALFAFAQRCAAVTAPSQWYADEAARQGMPGVRVLRLGVEARARVRSVTQDSPFVFVGTVSRMKGPDLVRRAHVKSGLAASLRIFGPPGPDPAYVASVPNDGPTTDVPAVLASARALVLGSRWPENSPLVVLEARAAGCPVLAPNIGGIPEIVTDGVDGLLYPPEDDSALADAMRRSMVTPFSPRPPPTLSEHLDAVERLYREFC